MEWLKEIHALRNVTTHMVRTERRTPRVEARRQLFAFFGRPGKDLVPILDARDAVQRDRSRAGGGRVGGASGDVAPVDGVAFHGDAIGRGLVRDERDGCAAIEGELKEDQ